MIKILIVDDHFLIRAGLKKILNEELDMNVVGETGNSSEVLEYVEKIEIDIVILDLSMPHKSGIETLKDLKYAFPNIPVLILSMHPEERFAIRTLKCGAAGYVTKGGTPEVLVKAIRKVVSGEKYISPSLAEKLVDEIVPGAEKPLHESLSDREYQIFLLLVSGKKVKEISKELSLNLRTVYTYRSRIFKKMKINTDTDLIFYAVQNNLVE